MFLVKVLLGVVCEGVAGCCLVLLGVACEDVARCCLRRCCESVAVNRPKGSESGSLNYTTEPTFCFKPRNSEVF